jgi:hypothetical protein
VRVPAAGRIPVRLAPGGDGDPREVWIRALDAAGAPLGLPGRDRVRLDDTAPVAAAAEVTATAPVVVCAPGGPAVAGTSRAAVPLEVRVRAAERGSGPALAQVAARPDPGAPWRAAGDRARVAAPAGGRVFLRLRDRRGNTSPWRAAVVPAAPERVAVPGDLPFTAALECPGPPPEARAAAVRAAFTATGWVPGDRAILRPPGSALDWTWYAGQGLQLNWVHAGTRLNARLAREPAPRYREAVSEILAHSTTDRAPGRAFRVNENRFTTPDDGQPPPWRDAMGTGVILALLVPAIAPDAPAGERDLARRVAGEYLATFSVGHGRGGVVWRDGGPGDWYLEYAYRTGARVLNGSMQAVVSLTRFARQADRLALRDPGWAPLAARARERARAGATAVARWLPAYDLGGGATRYSLTSGPAPERYRRYHVELLRLLDAVPWLPPGQRTVFRRYAGAWS